MSDTPRLFEEAWRDMEKLGYQYGRGALENVRLGWQMAKTEFGVSMKKHFAYKRFYEARAAFDAMNPTEVSADVYLIAADELREAYRAVKEMRGDG